MHGQRTRDSCLSETICGKLGFIVAINAARFSFLYCDKHDKPSYAYDQLPEFNASSEDD